MHAVHKSAPDPDTHPPAPCTWPQSLQVEYTARAVELSGLQDVSDSCLVELVECAAMSGHVLRVAFGAPLALMNFEARGITESGWAGFEPYRDSGLTGMNQVCGVADTGLDDSSCFLADDSGAYSNPRTDRTGKVQSLRRKVVQYVAYADDVDHEGGHGTHVAGSIAGRSLSDYSDVDGVAPDAKIAFFDVGMWVVSCPASHEHDLDDYDGV